MATLEGTTTSSNSSALATVGKYAHWGQWTFVPSETHPMGGMEFQTVLLLIGVYFALRGNGDSS